jgi:hypothetical protein
MKPEVVPSTVRNTTKFRIFSERWSKAHLINSRSHFFTKKIGDMFQKHIHKNYLSAVTGKIKADMPVTRGESREQKLSYFERPTL